MSITRQGNRPARTKLNPGDYMLKHGVFSALLKISIPIILLMLADATYAVLDSAMASNLVEYGNGVNAGDILSFAQPTLGFFFSLNMIFTVGTTFTFTKSIAKGDVEQARSEFGNGIVAGTGLSIAVIFIVWFTSPHIYSAFGNVGNNLPNQVIQEGVDYARVTSISLGVMMLRDQFGRSMRSEGYGTHYSLINISAFPLNLILNWVFMGVLGTGLVGAAYATLIASSFGFFMNMIMWFILYFKRNTNISLKLRYFRPRFKFIWLIVLFGISSGVRRMTGTINNITAINLINALGDNWKQFSNAASKSYRFAAQLGLGTAQGAAVLISFAHNRDDGQRVKDIVKKSTISIIIVQGVLLIASMTAAKQIMSLFNMTKVTQDMLNAWYLFMPSTMMSASMYIPIIYFATTRNVKESLIQVFIQNILFGVGGSLLFFGIYRWTGSVNTNLFFMYALVTTTLSALVIHTRFNKILNKNYVVNLNKNI